MAAIAGELERVVHRVLLLDIRRTTAVLEIVNAFITHECVLNTAKVDPEMRKLVREQRSGVQIVISVTVFPPIRRSPRSVAALGQRMSGRAEPQDIQQQRLIVAFPTVLEKSAFRLPAMRHRCATVLRPLPIRTAVERVGEGADVRLVGRIRIKIHSCRQCAGQQQRTIHCRQFALPGASAGLHVEKMIKKALIAARIWFGALRAVPEKTQRGQRSRYRSGTPHKSVLDSHRICRQREAGGGNAGRPIRRGLVDHQPVDWICLMQKVAECFVLKQFQFGLGG